MKTFDIAEIAALYRRGINVVQALRERDPDLAGADSPMALLYAYDVQSGSYTDLMKNPDYADLKRQMGAKLAAILAELGATDILEAGVGEATTLVPLLQHLPATTRRVLAFDISLSRLIYARKGLVGAGFPGADLFGAELSRIPLLDDSVDTVVTVHAVEPNGGREKEILGELLRVARRNLVMIEPAYELAPPAARARMESHGYVRGIPDALRALGFEPRRHELFGPYLNPANPVAVTVVVKESGGAGRSISGATPYASPISGKPLVAKADCLYCPDDGHAFPIINGIPCLATWNAVLCSHLEKSDIG